MLPHKTVQIPAHTVLPLFRKGQHRLRRVKSFPWLQRPGKPFRLYPGHHPGLSIRSCLYLSKVIAGVDQIKPIYLTGKFCCLRLADHKKRIAVMGGNSGGASEHLASLVQPQLRHMTLSCPGSGKGSQLPSRSRQVQLITQYFFQLDGRPTVISDLHPPGDHITVRIDCVDQTDADFILILTAVWQRKIKYQTLLAAVCSGHPLRGTVSFPVHCSGIRKITDAAAICQTHFQRVGTVIPLSGGR